MDITQLYNVNDELYMVYLDHKTYDYKVCKFNERTRCATFKKKVFISEVTDKHIVITEANTTYFLNIKTCTRFRNE